MSSLFSTSTTLLLFIWSIVDSEWISHSDNLMPREDTMMAVGSYNGSVYLLGGINNRQQITQYDIISDSFTFFKSSFIPDTTKVFGEAQFWTQMGCNLYILNDFDTETTKLSVYNMAENIYITDFDPMTIVVSDSMGRACIACYGDVIYVNGGVSPTQGVLQSTYFLNINSMQWEFTPWMKSARRSHSCIIHPRNKFLYSFGGATASGAMTSTIESISTVNIHDNTWAYLNGSLSEPGVRGLRSFVSGYDIIIIGGLDALRVMYDLIHVIDTRDDTVRVLSDRLVFKTVYSAAIMVGDRMYSFGGGLGLQAEWQSHTIANTTLPTTAPTILPTTTAPTAPTTSPVPSIAPSTTDTTNPNVTFETSEMGKFEPPEGKNIAAIFFVFLVVVAILIAIAVFCFEKRKKEKGVHKAKGFSTVSDKEIDMDENVNGNLDASGKFDDDEKTEMPLNPQMNDN